MWWAFKKAYFSVNGNIMWKETNLEHILDIIVGFDFIMSAELGKENGVIGWNIKTIGK